MIATNEELETLNEELQSISEEQQSTNEELESRNEELETVNEELQSTNEELSTLNDEVRNLADEADRMGVFLESLVEAWPRAVIGCDNDGVVALWSQRAAQQFLLSAAQVIGKKLQVLVPALDVPALNDAIAKVTGETAAPAQKITVQHGGKTLAIEVHAAAQAGRATQGFFLLVAGA